jgi:hypothetical protein
MPLRASRETQSRFFSCRDGVSPEMVGVCLIAIFFYVGFWLWTDWTIEDALIVARIARNFATHGILSFNTTQLISSATSPLFAFFVGLLATLGIGSVEAAKSTGITATLAVGWVLYVAARGIIAKRYALVTPAMYMLLPTTVAYTVGGLETPVYVLTCVMALFLTQRGRHKAALVWGALATVIRPDGFLVLAVILLAAWTKFKNYRQLIKWTMPTIVIIVVHFVIHYEVYGTVFPQSLLAKSQVYNVNPQQNIPRYLDRMFLAQPTGLPLYFLALLGAILGVRKQRQLVWLLVWYLVYHIAFMLRASLFSWYLHPPVFVVVFFASIAMAEIFEQLETKWLRQWLDKRFSVFGWSLVAVIVILALPANYIYGRGKLGNQTYDQEVPGAVGRWLTQNTCKTDLVFTESLGHIGFYTDNPFVDWPGLVTPDVPAMVKNLNAIQGYERIIETKMPIYLALRDREWQELSSDTKEAYEIVAQFSSSFPTKPGYIVAKRRCPHILDGGEF